MFRKESRSADPRRWKGAREGHRSHHDALVLLFSFIAATMPLVTCRLARLDHARLASGVFGVMLALLDPGVAFDVLGSFLAARTAVGGTAGTTSEVTTADGMDGPAFAPSPGDCGVISAMGPDRSWSVDGASRWRARSGEACAREAILHLRVESEHVGRFTAARVRCAGECPVPWAAGACLELGGRGLALHAADEYAHMLAATGGSVVPYGTCVLVPCTADAGRRAETLAARLASDHAVLWECRSDGRRVMAWPTARKTLRWGGRAVSVALALLWAVEPASSSSLDAPV